MPNELIALFDGQGQPIGTKERNCRLLRRRPRRLSLRLGGLAHVLPASSAPYCKPPSRPGDPYLGSLDAPAGGHIRAGETPTAAAHREFAEEVGITLTPAELVFLGQQPLQDTKRPAMQFFYLCTRPISLRETIFNEEVGAFVEVALDDFRRLSLRTSRINPRSGSLPGSTKQNKATGNYARSLCRLFRTDHGRHPPLG